jgi:CheY-like chemotaxis protein
MDGWFLLKNIRRTPELTGIPVLALTAHAMEGDRELVLSAGFDGYLSKPVNIHTFIDDILEQLPEHIRQKYEDK